MWPLAPLVCLSAAAAAAVVVSADQPTATIPQGDLPTVTIPQGELRPSLMTSAFDENLIYAFRGIPYGRVPRRFAAAEPAGPWQGVLNATADGPECLQWDAGAARAIGHEDCLYLNVYTRQLPPSNPTAPLVFVHGGDWLTGSGGSRWYGPRYWLEHDVILVTINYRLGAFGFATTSDLEAPGNQGLQDQLLALKWIDDNIEFFGGLRAHTTIMGEGAGAASVHFMQLTHKAKNLFERAISQSGTAFCAWAMVPESANNTVLLAERLACPVADKASMVACLRQVTGEEIARATAHMGHQLTGGAPFGPVVDFYSPEGILPKPPSELMAGNNMRHSPWIVGVNRDEGADMAYSLLNDPEKLQRLNGRFDEEAPRLLRFAHSASDVSATAAKIRKHYFGSRPIDDSSARQLVELLTDRMFLHCTEKAAWWHAFYSTHKVFVYQWNLKGRLGFRDLEHAHRTGDEAAHWHPSRSRHARGGGSSSEHDLGISQKDELLLMFSNELAPLYDKSDPLVYEIRSILNMWITFAKAGDPTPDINGLDLGVWREYWEYYYPHDPHYLVIDREWETVTELPASPALKFWDSLELNENKFKTKLVIRDEL